MTAAVRTRFAPSPTGDLHVGGARTALFNKLFAMHHNGAFVLRIEDTDIERSDKAFEKSILKDLEWLGLNWDEGPIRQSERIALYKDKADKLLKAGLAYRCYCTKERLEELKNAQIKAGIPPGYDGRCARTAPTENDTTSLHVIRFKVPRRQVEFIDGVHGKVAFDSRTLTDFVIIGSDGVAAYNFAAAIDDSDMKITHVIRGDDHLANTPRQILIFEAVNTPAPDYYHVPLVLGANKAPLSKRDRTGSMHALKEDGYLPEAIINSIARLGWTPKADMTGARLLNLKELAERFDGNRLSRSASIFDTGRISAYNKEAIGSAPNERLIKLAGINAQVADDLMDAIKKSASTINEIGRLISAFISEPVPDEDGLKVLSEPYAKAVIKAFAAELEKAPANIDKVRYDDMMKKVTQATNEKGKRLYMPIRLALTAQAEGLELIKTIGLLERSKAIERLNKYADQDT